MKANGSRINELGKVSFHTRMEVFMKAYLTTVKDMIKLQIPTNMQLTATMLRTLHIRVSGITI